MKRIGVILLVACKSAAPDPVAPIGTTSPSLDAPAVYSFDSLDARPVSSDAFRGKTTVISFITTGDFPKSQRQVTVLVTMAKNDGDTVNYAIVAMQDPSSRALVEEYGRFCHVTFPVAMGDPNALASAGPFGNIEAIPTTVILDAAGRVVFRASDFVSSKELRTYMPR